MNLVSNNSDVRLDVYVSENVPECTRSYIKTLIDDKQITVNGKIVKGEKMLKSINRLRKRKEFAYLYNNGTAKHSEHLTLVYLPTKHRPLKVGFSISKKTGKAWLRNKVKRQLRDSVRNLTDNINSSYNYVFVTKPEITTLNYEQIKNAVDGDVIVLAGKGHEDYQEIKGVKYHMDERELIAEILEAHPEYRN